MAAPKETDRLTGLTKATDEVKGMVHKNIIKLEDRYDRLDHLEDKADMLQHEAGEFKKGAKQVKDKKKWQHLKLWIILIVILVLIVLVIVAIGLGVGLRPK